MYSTHQYFSHQQLWLSLKERKVMVPQTYVAAAKHWPSPV